MTSLIPVGISGMGRYVPERRVPNTEFESLLDTSDEWISQRTGIHERRYARDDELTSDMGAVAAREAIADAGLTPDDIDLVICCTVTPDYPFPATACQIGHKIGAERAGGFDLMAACSGWVLGALTASQYVATGAMRHVLVVGVEKLSSVIDFEDRTTCVIFADGAGATVFSPLEFAKRRVSPRQRRHAGRHRRHPVDPGWRHEGSSVRGDRGEAAALHPHGGSPGLPLRREHVRGPRPEVHRGSHDR
jgi:3-oxoacyl-(acyl-carrier-protein) synthase III